MNFSKLKNHPKIRLLLADDHTILRQGLAKLLGQEIDIEIVGEAPNGEIAVNLTAQLHPDVILMDMGMPKMDGLEATRRIHAAFPDIRIIGLSMYDEMERSDDMMAAGASLYLTKAGPVQELITAIRSCSKAVVSKTTDD
jgi:DNA-binding NarL/FixJ family response regulator